MTTRLAQHQEGKAEGKAQRRPLVVGNWKMNGDRAGNERLIAALRADLDGAVLGRVDVAVCPPSIYLGQVAQALAGSAVAWGGQDVAAWAKGAYTGETSAAMLVDLGATWTLVGHSERRTLMGETDQRVAEKAARAIDQGLGVIVCVGETLEEREQGQTDAVIRRQVEAVAALGSRGPVERFVLAYEPVWAIGTGRTATPEQAQEVHANIRAGLARAGVAAEGVRILYGGSVKPDSAAGLFAQADIDGGLIGGAALVSADFAAICRAA